MPWKDHHFLLGQAVNQFKANSPNEPYVSWVKKWPRADFIRYMTFGNSEALLVTSLAAHKEILQTKCYSFIKPPFLKRLIVDIVGLGLMFAEGEDHKNQRKAFRGMSTIFGERTDDHYVIWLCEPSKEVADVSVGILSLSNLKSFVPLFLSKAEELSDLFDRAIAKEGGIVERSFTPCGSQLVSCC
jgi:hypothetical protein